MARYTKQTAVEAMQAYCGIADKYGVTATGLALAWCQAQSWTACSIIGATSVKQLKASTHIAVHPCLDKKSTRQ